MNLFENPFYILGVSTRDSKQRIVEACDEKSLTLDSEMCIRFRSMLTQPRNRITAEISWLPGVAPSRALNLLEKIKTDPRDLFNSVKGSDPLVKCNALAALLKHHTFKESPVNYLIITIAKAFDEINYDNLLSTINEDRHLAGLPLVQESEYIKEAIQEHGKYLVCAMRDALNNAPNPDIVFTKIVEHITSNGQVHPPLLIADLTELYKIEVQKYLDKLAQEIRAITEDIQSHNNIEKIDSALNLLEKKVKSWDQIVQPIQLVMQSKGMEDRHSREIADELRRTTIYLANELEMHEAAQRVSILMAGVFKELPQFAERVSEDLSVLEDILNRKVRSAEEERKWREEVSIDIEIGKVFKDRLVITPEIISYKNRNIKPADVSCVRWGKLIINSRSFNTIWVGTPSHMFEIECNTTFESTSTVEKRYESITDSLWKLVCVRLIGETLCRLSSGEKLVYGDAVVDKDGILLRKSKFFGSEPFYSKWEGLTTGHVPGAFVIQSRTEKKARADLSYRGLDNVHILEAVMRFLWKDGNHLKLSRGEFS